MSEPTTDKANSPDKNTLNEPLVSPKSSPPKRPKQTLREKLNQWMCPKKQTDNRKVYLNGVTTPPNYFSNRIRNQKSNAFTILPVFLYNEFKFFINLFFLLVTVSQFFEEVRVGLLITYVSPLVLVLGLSFAKEVYDEIKRAMKDKQVNSEEFQKLTLDGDVTVLSSDIEVGDIIKLNKNRRIPADMLLLWTSDDDGILYLKTDQLDGETDWKVREAVKMTQKFLGENNPVELLKRNFHLDAEAPSKEIYDFKGTFYQSSADFEPMRLKNTAWAHTTVAAGEAYGLVIYTGKETRMEMNSRKPITKCGKTDKEINVLSKFLFSFVIALSVSLLLMSQTDFTGTYWMILLIRYVLLLSSIIPISLRVNVDFAKIYYALLINGDKSLNGALTRNSTIPEELGRIEYLLSDKTGTLTQNKMIFKKLSTLITTFTNENLEILKEFVIKDAQARPTVGEPTEVGRKKGKYALMRETLTSLMVCHNVTPTMDNGERILQAASPDEIALVKFAESLGFVLESRDVNNIKIRNPEGNIEEFEVIQNFPFSSERKRMGILVREKSTQNLIFYLKGADTIIKEKVDRLNASFVEEECETLAKDGLRTLVITQKRIPEEEYEKWESMMKEASLDLQNREKREAEVIDILEENMELLAITGVEDLLQDDIKPVIESLRDAGIKVWMLTGDKLETAKCIAISTGLKSTTQRFFDIHLFNEETEFMKALQTFEANPSDVIVVQGKALAKIFSKDKLKIAFLKTASLAPAVVCCRCAPTQKSEITESMKNIFKKTVCGIGDGGNDVGMIMSANLGIGIEGKEGMQAALCSDFSIKEFKTIQKLFLWHGRLAYVRTALLTNFILHRGLIISVIQFLFTSAFQYASIQVYNGWLMLGYATIFTMFPVFALILTEDVTERQVIDYPILYKVLQSGRELNAKKFLLWSWMSIYQGAVIILMCILLFESSFFEVVTITFTSLIMIELLNIVSSISHYTWKTLTPIFLSFFSYLFCMFVLRELFLLAKVNFTFMLRILMIVGVAWGPIRLVNYLKKIFAPSMTDKIRREAKEKQRLEKMVMEANEQAEGQEEKKNVFQGVIDSFF